MGVSKKATLVYFLRPAGPTCTIKTVSNATLFYIRKKKRAVVNIVYRQYPAPEYLERQCTKGQRKIKSTSTIYKDIRKKDVQ